MDRYNLFFFFFFFSFISLHPCPASLCFLGVTPRSSSKFIFHAIYSSLPFPLLHSPSKSELLLTQNTVCLSHPLIYRNLNVVIPFVHIFLLTLYALSQFFPLLLLLVRYLPALNFSFLIRTILLPLFLFSSCFLSSITIEPPRPPRALSSLRVVLKTT